MFNLLHDPVQLVLSVEFLSYDGRDRIFGWGKTVTMYLLAFLFHIWKWSCHTLEESCPQEFTQIQFAQQSGIVEMIFVYHE